MLRRIAAKWTMPHICDKIYKNIFAENSYGEEES